jgi:hypothetical protein
MVSASVSAAAAAAVEALAAGGDKSLALLI